MQCETTTFKFHVASHTLTRVLVPYWLEKKTCPGMQRLTRLVLGPVAAACCRTYRAEWRPHNQVWSASTESCCDLYLFLKPRVIIGNLVSLRTSTVTVTVSNIVSSGLKYGDKKNKCTFITTRTCSRYNRTFEV